MSQLAADTFIRANQSGWGTASDGVDTWAHLVGNVGTLAIASNEGTFTGATNPVRMVLGSGTTGDGDLLVRVAATSTSDKFGLALRATQISSQITDYRFDVTGPTTVTLIKTVSATNTNLANATIPAWTINTFYWMRFRVVGSYLLGKWWQDGSSEPAAWTITASDTSVVGAGQYGVFIALNAAGDTVSFDHFLATDLSTKTAQTRFVLRTQNTLSAPARTILQVQRTLSARTRTVLRTLNTKTAPTRLVLRTQATKIAQTRALVRVQRTFSAPIRLVLRTQATKIVPVRALLRTQLTKTSPARVILRVQNTRTAQVRTRLSIQASKTAQVRCVLVIVPALSQPIIVQAYGRDGIVAGKGQP